MFYYSVSTWFRRDVKRDSCSRGFTDVPRCILFNRAALNCSWEKQHTRCTCSHQACSCCNICVDSLNCDCLSWHKRMGRGASGMDVTVVVQEFFAWEKVKCLTSGFLWRAKKIVGFGEEEEKAVEDLASWAAGWNSWSALIGRIPLNVREVFSFKHKPCCILTLWKPEWVIWPPFQTPSQSLTSGGCFVELGSHCSHLVGWPPRVAAGC